MRLRLRGLITTLALAWITLALALINSAHPAHAASQTTPLWLPWEGGTTWSYTQGPHGASGEGLDFQPPDAAGQECEKFTSSYWIVAAGDGMVISLPNALEIDHGNGFRTGYFHIQDKQVTSGFVHAGDRLGHPGCCPDEPGGCIAEAPHLHFYTSYKGARQNAEGLNIGGWIVQMNGCLARDDREACRQASLISNAPKSDGAPPSNPADIVLVVAAAPGKGEMLLNAAAALMAVSRVNDRIAIVQTTGDAPIIRRLTTGDSAAVLALVGEPTTSTSIPGDTQQALIRACQELVIEGIHPHRSVVILTAERSPVPSMSADCFAGNHWDVFSYDIAAMRTSHLEAKTDGDPAMTRRLISTRTLLTWRELDPTVSAMCEVQRLRRLASGEAAGTCRTYALSEDALLTVPFTVPPDQMLASFSVKVRCTAGAGWTFVPDATLVGPDGLAAAIEDRRWDSASCTLLLNVDHPRSGEWTVVVSGSGAPAGGAYLTTALTTIAIPSVLPDPTETPEATEVPTEGSSPTDTPTPTPTKEDRSTRTPPAGPHASASPTPDDVSVTPTVGPTASPSDTPASAAPPSSQTEQPTGP